MTRFILWEWHTQANVIQTKPKKPRMKIKAVSRGTHMAKVEIGREDVSKRLKDSHSF